MKEVKTRLYRKHIAPEKRKKGSMIRILFLPTFVFLDRGGGEGEEEGERGKSRYFRITTGGGGKKRNTHGVMGPYFCRALLHACIAIIAKGGEKGRREKRREFYGKQIYN